MGPDRPSRLTIRGSGPLVMGILNVTPDSFSDGGDYFDPPRAVDRALAMVAEGADIIDVGPESTRPGSQRVSAADQIRRAIRVIEAVRAADRHVILSIDTRNAVVARRAIDAGADVINDVSALRDDDDMARVAADTGTWVVLIHMRGTPATMQAGGGPCYEDVVAEVRAFLTARRDAAIDAGIASERIILDPGIGFGKRIEDNWRLVGALDRFVALGQPVLVGASRKRFLAMPRREDHPKERLPGSLACAVVAVMKGASIVRVHDVWQTKAALHVLSQIREVQPNACGSEGL